MVNTAAFRLVTPRDLDVFHALDHCPLTVPQLLKFSETFAYPFTAARRVRHRLEILAACGRVHRWQYATAGRGAPNYYTLSRIGYQLLNGPDAEPPTKRYFSPIAIARQEHTRCLADFIVHTAVAAHRAGTHFTGFYRENTVGLTVGTERLYPDCSFQLVARGEPELSFFVELDNCTERVHSARNLDSWQRKIRLYDRFQDTCRVRFRVLVLTTGTTDRLQHILAAAAGLMQNTQRSLIYGATLDSYLAQQEPLAAASFLDHRSKQVSLLRTARQPLGATGRAASTAVLRAGFTE